MVRKEAAAPKKKKCPTAMKRVKQNKKQNLQNRLFNSRTKTAIRSFKKAILMKNEGQMRSALNSVYSLLDKGVKNGVYKKNKAARTKSRIALLSKGNVNFV